MKKKLFMILSLTAIGLFSLVLGISVQPTTQSYAATQDIESYYSEYTPNTEETGFSYKFLREIYNEVKLIMPYNSIFDVYICDDKNRVLISLTDEQDIEYIIIHLRERGLYETEAVLFVLPSTRNLNDLVFRIYPIYLTIGIIITMIILIYIIVRLYKTKEKTK